MVLANLCCVKPGTPSKKARIYLIRNTFSMVPVARNTRSKNARLFASYALLSVDSADSRCASYAAMAPVWRRM